MEKLRFNPDYVPVTRVLPKGTIVYRLLDKGGKHWKTGERAPWSFTTILVTDFTLNGYSSSAVFTREVSALVVTTPRDGDHSWVDTCFLGYTSSKQNKEAAKLLLDNGYEAVVEEVPGQGNPQLLLLSTEDSLNYSSFSFCKQVRKPGEILKASKEKNMRKFAISSDHEAHGATNFAIFNEETNSWWDFSTSSWGDTPDWERRAKVKKAILDNHLNKSYSVKVVNFNPGHLRNNSRMVIADMFIAQNKEDTNRVEKKFAINSARSIDEAIMEAVNQRLKDSGWKVETVQNIDIDGGTEEDAIDDPEMFVDATVVVTRGSDEKETFSLNNDGGEWTGVYDFLAENSIKNSKEKNMRRFALKSARGEVSDSTRQLVRDILDQVPALVKVPAKQQGIKKEPYGPDHVCYFYTEEGPRKGSFVTVEFHVDPSDLYTDIFITTRASFAAAADGGEARQDEREVTLDEFVIEDLEDYSLSDIDKIDAAVTKGFEGAQKFDEQAASTIESRKALFSSKHKQFIDQSKKGKIYSEIPGLARYIQEIMDEEGVTREEAEEIARERISVGI